jgi:hypothetical protein
LKLLEPINNFEKMHDLSFNIHTVTYTVCLSMVTMQNTLFAAGDEAEQLHGNEYAAPSV